MSRTLGIQLDFYAVRDIFSDYVAAWVEDRYDEYLELEQYLYDHGFTLPRLDMDRDARQDFENANEWFYCRHVI